MRVFGQAFLQLDIIYIMRQSANVRGFLAGAKAPLSGLFRPFRVKSKIKPFFDTLPPGEYVGIGRLAKTPLRGVYCPPSGVFDYGLGRRGWG